MSPETTRILLAAAGIFAALIAIWVFAPTLQGPAAAKKHFGSHRLALGSVIVVFLANVVLTVPFAELFRGAGLSGNTFLLAALATQGPMVAIVFLRGVLPDAVSWGDLGLKALPFRRLVTTGLATGLVSMGLVIGIGAALAQFGVVQNQLSGQFGFVRELSLPSFLLMLLVAAVLAPAAEELFFRGYIFGSYIKRKPAWISYGASGLLFASLHADPTSMNGLQAVGLMIPIFTLGTLFAWTFRRTGSLYPGMIAHAFNNSVSLVLLYAFGLS